MDLSIKSKVEEDKSSISLSITSSPTSLKSEDEDQNEENVMPIETPSISTNAASPNQFIAGTSFPNVSTTIDNNLNLLAQAVLCNSRQQTMMGTGGNSGQYLPSQTPVRTPWNSSFSFLPGYSHHPSYLFPGNNGFSGPSGNDVLSRSPSKSSSTLTSASSTATSTSSSVGLPAAAPTTRSSVSLESGDNSELFGNRRRQVRHNPNHPFP